MPVQSEDFSAFDEVIEKAKKAPKVKAMPEEDFSAFDEVIKKKGTSEGLSQPTDGLQGGASMSESGIFPSAIQQVKQKQAQPLPGPIVDGEKPTLSDKTSPLLRKREPLLFSGEEYDIVRNYEKSWSDFAQRDKSHTKIVDENTSTDFNPEKEIFGIGGKIVKAIGNIIPGIGQPKDQGKKPSYSWSEGAIKNSEQDLSRYKQRADASLASLKPQLEKISKYAKDNYNQFTDTSFSTGLPITDVNKIDKYSRELAKKIGVNETGNFKTLVYNEIKAAVSHKLIEPEVIKKFKELYQKETGRSYDADLTPTKEKVKIGGEKYEIEKGFEKGKEILSGLNQQANTIKLEVQDKQKQDVDILNQELKGEVDKLSQQFKVSEEVFKQKYQGLIVDDKFVGSQDQYNQYLIDSDNLKKQSTQLGATAEKLSNDFISKQHLIANKANARYRRQIDEISRLAYDKYNKELQKYYSVFKANPQLAERSERLYKQAYNDVLNKNEELKELISNTNTSPAVNFFRSTLASLGGSIKGISTSMGFDAGSVFGDYLEKNFEVGSPELKSLSDLLDFQKLARSGGQLAGSMLPTMAIELPAMALTRGVGGGVLSQMLVGGVIQNTIETADIAGRMKADVFAKTGDPNAAQKAAEEAMQSQYYAIPFNVISTLPFIGGSTKMIKNAVGRVLASGAVEFSSELPVEYWQNLAEESIKETGTYKNALKFHTNEKLGSTALNIAPVFLMGAAGELMPEGKSADQKMIEREAKSFALKTKFADLAPSQKNQFVFDLVQRKGNAFAATFLTSLYTTGNIDKTTLDNLGKTLQESNSLISKSKELGLTPADQKIFMAFQMQYNATQKALEGEQDPILKKALETKLKSYETEINNFTTNKKGNYVVLTYPNNEQYVLTYSEAENALNNAEFSNALGKGDIKVDAFGDNAAFNQKVEQAKKDYEAKKPVEEAAVKAEPQEGEQVYRVDYKDEQGSPATKYFRNEEESRSFYESTPGEKEGYYDKFPRGGKIEAVTPTGAEAVPAVTGEAEGQKVEGAVPTGGERVGEGAAETAPAVLEGEPETVVGQDVVIQQMKPFTDEMVKIEREFENNNYEISTDYDNEIIVTDKDGEIVDAEDLPPNLLKLAQDYEKAVGKLGEFDASAMERALAESRKVEEGQAEVVETEQAKLPPIKEGATAQLPPQVKGGISRDMVFKDGEWQQQVGGQVTKVGAAVQQQAQQQWEADNKPAAAAKVTPEAKPTVAPKGKPKVAPPSKAAEKLKKAKERKEAAAAPSGMPKEGINVSNKSDLVDLLDRVQEESKKRILQAAQKGINTLKSIFPDMDIYVHEDADSYNRVMTSLGLGKNSRGNFVFYEEDGKTKGRIDINLSNAAETTVAHEITHAILLKQFGENPAQYKQFRERISKVIEKSLDKELTRFEAKYKGLEVAPEEYLTQLAAMLAISAEKVTYNPTTLRKIAAIINEFVTRITNGKFSPFKSEADFKNFVDFLNQISGAIREGKEVVVKEPQIQKKGLPLTSPEIKTRQDIGEQVNKMPMSADNVLYSDSDVLPKPPKKTSNSSVAKLLQEVASKFWGNEIVTSSTITPKQEEIITNNGIKEAVQAFKSSGKNAADWYSKAIETAIAVAGVIHPELKSVESASKVPVFAKEKDPVRAAQMALRIALAITSQNLNVDANTIYAEEQFNYFKKNGKFDPSKEYGAKAPAISSNLKLANILIEILGLNEAENFISKEFTVKDLEDAFKSATGKKLSILGLRNDIVNGAAIFGPKIGQGFLQNLMGKFDPVTIDLWMRRTWGRWTGDVVGVGITEKRMARLYKTVKEAIGNNELKITLPKEFSEYRPVQRKKDSGKLYWTMNEKFTDRIENDLDFVNAINKVAKEIAAIANTLYKAIHDIPMSKELYDKFLSGEMSYVQVAKKLISVRESLGNKYAQYVAKERAKGRKPIKKGEWISLQEKELGRIYSPKNEEISERKPQWGNEAKNIVHDLNPIDVPSNMDRRVITRVVNNIRKGMNEQGYNVTNADVQALLWYPEKDIWAKLRGEKESNLKLSYDDQFIKLATEKGLGEQAQKIANEIRSRGATLDITASERKTDEGVSSKTTKKEIKSRQDLSSDSSSESKIERNNTDIVSASVNVAPLYSTKVTSVGQAKQLHESEFYRKFKEENEKLAEALGLTIENQYDGVGGFGGVSEATTYITLRGSFEDIVKFSALRGALAPEVQESTIAGTYVKSGDKAHNGDKIEFGIDNVEAAMKAAKDAGFEDAGYTLLDNEISFFDIFEYHDAEFDNKIDKFAEKYKEYGGQITGRKKLPVRSEYIDAQGRKEIIANIERDGVRQFKGGASILDVVATAQKRNESFLKWKEVNDSEALKEYRNLRAKQIELGEKGEVLDSKDSDRIKALEKILVEPLASIISTDKEKYEQAKNEIEAIADDVASLVNGGFVSKFGIKRPSRAAIKVVRWYDSQPNLLGDGARTNVIVNTEADADFLHNEIKRRYATELDRREGTTTELGYPKRLTEIKTPSGKISEIQVMTPQGYLAKDGVKYFPEDAKNKAQKSLEEVRERLGWDIPDGVGHYFYEINRDFNVPKKLRDQAAEVSNRYYDAFMNPESKLSDAEFRKLVKDFKDNVDAADKSKWDEGNEGIAPEELNKYLEKPTGIKSRQDIGEDYSEMKDIVQDYLDEGISLDDTIESITSELGDSSQETKDLITRAYNELKGGKPEEKSAKPEEAPKVEDKEAKKEFDELISSEIDNFGTFTNYLSGKTIKKYEGDELRNEQQVLEQQLRPALERGLEIIQKAKEVFGDNYVAGLLNYLETANISPEKKALAYVSLENDLAKRKIENPSDAPRIEKLQDLVRAASQAYLRSNSLAINFGRLRKFAEIGYDVSKMTDRFFSSRQLEDKKKIEEAIQAKPDQINKAAEEKIKEDEEIKKKVEEGVEAEIAKLFEKFSDAKKKVINKSLSAIDKAMSKLSSKSYKSGFKSRSDLDDAMTEGFKKIKRAMKAGISPAEAIEIGIKEIKSIYEKEYGTTWTDEAAFRKDLTEALKAEGAMEATKEKFDIKRLEKEILDLDRQIEKGQKDKFQKKKTAESEALDKLREKKAEKQAILEALDPTPRIFIENALIEQGFGREINVRTKDGVEKRMVLDWKKLAGEEGSVDNIRERVEAALRDKGYSEEQILRMKDAFVEEYNNLAASIAEKALNEINAKNKEGVTIEQKSAVRKLVEMYNYGLFDKDPVEYETALAKTLGVTGLGVDAVRKMAELGQTMSNLFNSNFEGQPLNESTLRTAIQVIEEQARVILNMEALKGGNWGFKVTELTRMYMDVAQRMMLNTFKQGLENPISGLLERFYSSVAYAGKIPETLNAQQRKLARDIYREMVLQKGLGYGNVGNAFITTGNIDAYINKLPDSALVQGIMSVAMGKTILDAVDSSYKAKITQQKFTYNLIKILTKDRVINGKTVKGMSLDEAKKYVAEKISGQSFEKAKQTAKEIIDRVNRDAGRKIFNDSPQFVNRLANDIVNAALINGEAITEEMVTAAYNAAYRAAGRGLGHVSNNYLTSGVNYMTGKIETQRKKAIEEKRFTDAAFLNIYSMLFRNVLNPFVGGGTNWIVLKAEKTGLGLISGFINKVRNSSKIDMTSETGMKELENAMYDEMKANDKLTRGAIGGMVTALAFLLIKGTGAEDEYEKWIKKNPWAKKYINVFTPEIVLLMVAANATEKDYKKYLENTLNLGDQFDKGKMALKVLYSKDWSTQLGTLLGSSIGNPLPWRLVRDGQQLWAGATGGEPYVVSKEKPKDFSEAYLKGGMFDFFKDIMSKEPKEKKIGEKFPESKGIKWLEDKNADMPELPDLEKIKVNVDDKHPEGKMIAEEQAKFKEIWEAEAVKVADQIQKNHEKYQYTLDKEKLKQIRQRISEVATKETHEKMSKYYKRDRLSSRDEEMFKIKILGKEIE